MDYAGWVFAGFGAMFCLFGLRLVWRERALDRKGVRANGTVAERLLDDEPGEGKRVVVSFRDRRGRERRVSVPAHAALWDELAPRTPVSVLYLQDDETRARLADQPAPVILPMALAVVSGLFVVFGVWTAIGGMAAPALAGG